MEVLFVPNMTGNRPPKPDAGMLFWAERTKRKTEPLRCQWVLWKWHAGTSPRSLKPSPWRCSKEAGHSGSCLTRPRANQRSEFHVLDDWAAAERTHLTAPPGFVYCTHLPDLSKKIGRGRSAAARMFEPFKFHRSGTGFAHCWAVDDPKRAEGTIHNQMKSAGLWLHHELFEVCADPYVAKYLSLSRGKEQGSKPHPFKAQPRYE